MKSIDAERTQWKEDGQNIASKQAACAAHMYGRTYAAAEAFTKMGPHWEESFADLRWVSGPLLQRNVASGENSRKQ